MLWTLINEIPAQMRKTHKIIRKGHLLFFRQESWLNRSYQVENPFTIS
jgi:hypothetical protein